MNPDLDASDLIFMRLGHEGSVESDFLGNIVISFDKCGENRKQG